MSARHATAGRLGAYAKWGRTVDRAAATEAARRASEGRWEREVRAEFPDLDDRTVEQLAAARRKAHFIRLGQASAAARRRKKAAA